MIWSKLTSVDLKGQRVRIQSISLWRILYNKGLLLALIQVHYSVPSRQGTLLMQYVDLFQT